MANYNKKINETNIRIGEVRFSYAHVFEPQTDDEGKEKYSVAVLWPKTETGITKLVEDAVTAAKEKGKLSKWGGKIPGNCKSPIRDGDTDREEDDTYSGMYFINCSSRQKPGVRVLDSGKVVEALDGEDFYSGCWGAVTLNFFPYDSRGNKGVGAGLNNLIKTRDDERLSGGPSADQDFSDLGDDALD
jgi:hypothetical protein